jgi:lysozyme family protein
MPTVKEMLDTVIKHEGGYQDDAEDHGNFYKGQNLGTNYGITPKALAAFRGEDVTKDDMYTLTEEEARAVYRKEYVAPILRMNPPKEVVPHMVDMAINHGPRNAVKILQKAVGATPDGAYGPGTKKAIQAYKGDLSTGLVESRKGFYEGVIQNRPHMEKYRNGWMNRAESWRPVPAGPSELTKIARP